MTKATFNVPEMSCGHCKATVEGKLNKLSGVERSNADFEKGIVEVSYDEDRVTTGELEDAIEEAGYSVTA
ncbi:MAG TPA: copper ion binding protein [Rubrobacteraceae bacterium]|nr:copper ion binding protein [Rubrobacteraceae bacterium]